MSGVLENVVENWLTNASERGYQASFAALLASEGHRIVYYSRHGGLEHGKDIVTQCPSGRYHAYQLKVGDISVAAWRAMVGEVQEASNLPMSYPGEPKVIPDTATLVTTGNISDNAREKIRLVGESLAASGCAPLETIEKAELTRRLTNAFETFLPGSLADVVELLRLYIEDEKSLVACGEMAVFFERLVVQRTCTNRVDTKRLLSSLLVVGEFLASRPREFDNHVAVIQVWTLATVACHMVMEKADLKQAEIDSALGICKAAIEEASESFVQQCIASDSMLTDSSFGDVALVGVRRLYTMSYLAGVANSRYIDGVEDAPVVSILVDGIRSSELPGAWGEGAWNFYLNIACAMHRHSESRGDAVRCVENWVKYLMGFGESGPPDPYHTLEDEFERLLGRMRDDVVFQSGRSTYTLRPAVDFLGRVGRRAIVARQWKQISQKQFMEVIPDNAFEAMRYRIRHGVHRKTFFPMRASWSDLQRAATRCRTDLFGSQAWIMPFYLLVFPHRVGPRLSRQFHWLTADQYYRSRWEQKLTFGKTTAQ